MVSSPGLWIPGNSGFTRSGGFWYGWILAPVEGSQLRLVDPGSSESLVDPGIGGSWLWLRDPSSGWWILALVDLSSSGSQLR